MDDDDESSLWPETKVQVFYITEALRHQSSHYEQEKREGGLGHDQGLLWESRMIAACAIRAPKRLGRIRVRRYPGRSDSEDYSGDQREQERKPEDGKRGAGIDRNDLCSAEGDQQNRAATQISQNQSCGSAYTGQQNALCKRGSYQTCAGRSYGQLQCGLLTPGCAAS